MRRLRIVLLLALVVVGCQGDGSGEWLARPASSAPTATAGRRALDPAAGAEPVAGTGTGAGGSVRAAGTTALPSTGACTAAGATALLNRFFAAFSDGRVERLDQFFAPAGRFKWYANTVRPGLRLNDVAMDRGSLLGYLQWRQVRHERITVGSVHFNGYRDADRTAHFAMLLRRTADDIRGGPQLLAGKGAVDCESQRLMVVAIGRRS